MNEAIAKACEGVVTHVSVEDFLPQAVASAMPAGVHVGSIVPDGTPFPFVLIEEATFEWPHYAVRDEVDFLPCEVHVFAEGIDAKVDAHRLAWLVWKRIEALADEHYLLPGRAGSSVQIAGMAEVPARRADWADAVGPVQYQDLPQGVERYSFTCFVTVHHYRR